MRLIRGNVERIAATEEQAARLQADGFVEVAGRSGENRGVSETGGQTFREPAGRMPVPDAGIETMGVRELRIMAKEQGLGGCSGLSKEQLIAVLKEDA